MTSNAEDKKKTTEKETKFVIRISFFLFLGVGGGGDRERGEVGGRRNVVFGGKQRDVVRIWREKVEDIEKEL